MTEQIEQLNKMKNKVEKDKTLIMREIADARAAVDEKDLEKNCWWQAGSRGKWRGVTGSKSGTKTTRNKRAGSPPGTRHWGHRFVDVGVMGP
jgi:hypothetical protein